MPALNFDGPIVLKEVRECRQKGFSSIIIVSSNVHFISYKDTLYNVYIYIYIKLAE